MQRRPGRSRVQVQLCRPVQLRGPLAVVRYRLQLLLPLLLAAQPAVQRPCAQTRQASKPLESLTGDRVISHRLRPGGALTSAAAAAAEQEAKGVGLGQQLPQQAGARLPVVAQGPRGQHVVLQRHLGGARGKVQRVLVDDLAGVHALRHRCGRFATDIQRLQAQWAQVNLERGPLAVSQG